MAAKTRDVTDAELAILEVLWDRGAATVRELTDTLYPSGAASEYATVQKLLDRLEGKSHVRRDRSKRPFTYMARTAREDLIVQRLQDTADRLCSGSWTPLLTHLVKNEPLSEDERRSLRSMLDELDSGIEP